MGKNFSRDFWIRIGFQNGFLHIIFKLHKLCLPFRNYSVINSIVHSWAHRIKDDRMENYGAYISFISKQHCRAAKDCFSRREFVQQTADCVGAGLLRKFSFSIISQNFCVIINFVKISCFAKFEQCCFAATLCRSRGGGVGEWGVGGLACTALRTLPAKADCAYIGVHL